MVDVMDIRPLDVSDDRAMRSAYAVETAANEHSRPGWRGAGADARMLGWRTEDGWVKRLLGAWHDDAEAPNGELAWLESPVTADEYLEEIDLWNAQGSTVVETVAVDAGGDAVAWTCLVTSETQGGHARIEGTFVLQHHRGHGLGAAVKLANLQTARALGGVGRVRTSTDDQNTWMRSINTMLGFVPVEFEAIFQRTVKPGRADVTPATRSSPDEQSQRRDPLDDEVVIIR